MEHNIGKVMLQSTVTQKGQITIPAEVRRGLGIEEGDIICFTNPHHNTITLIVKHRASISVLEGFLPKPKKTLTIAQMQSYIEKGSE